MKARKCRKSILAYLLILAMVVNFFQGVELISKAAESTGYTELTFSDWGFADGLVTANTNKAKTPVTSLDGVAFNGIVNFVGSNSGCLRLGGVSNEWCGLHIKYNATQNGLFFGMMNNAADAYLATKYIKETEAKTTLHDTDVKIRVTFDVVDADLTIGIYINDKYMGDLTVTGGAEHLGTKFLIVSSNGVSIKSVMDYRELTFADLGIEEKTYTSANAVGTLPTGITSLDGVAFRGRVTFPSTTQESYINIGHSSLSTVDSSGIRFFLSSSKLYLWDKTGGGNHQVISPNEGDTFGDVPIEFYISFRVLGDNVVVGAKVTTEANTYTKEYTMTGWANAMGTGFFVNSHAAVGQPITVASTYADYKQVGFTDYSGVTEGEFTGGASTKEKYAAYTGEEITVSGLAFEGDVTFMGTGSFIYLASKGTWKGIQLTQNASRLAVSKIRGGAPEASFTIQNETAGIQYGKNFHLRVEFQITDGTDLIVRVFINGKWQAIAYWIDTMDVLGNGLYLYSAAEQSLYLGKQETPLSQYERLTPVEFGLDDMTVSGGTQKAGNSFAGTGLHETYLDMNLTFYKGNGFGDSVRFVSYNGWTGLYLAMGEDGGSTKLRLGYTDTSASAVNYSAADLGIAYGEKFRAKIYLQLEDIDTEAATQTVKVILFINDTQVTESAVSFAGVKLNASGVAHQLSVYAPSGSVTIGTPYQSVNLSELGIADKRYMNETATGTYSGESLDGVALESTITFATGNAAGSNNLSIGGKFLIGYDCTSTSKRILMWDTSGNGQHGVFAIGSAIAKDIADKPISLKLTFDFINEDVRVGLYVNRTYIGKNVFTGAASTFTNTVKVTSTDKPILIGKAYTEWTLWDWGVENGSISAATENLEVSNRMISTYDKAIFTAKLKFPSGATGNNSLRIGGWSNETEDKKWYGLQIYAANTNELYAWDNFGTAQHKKLMTTENDISAQTVTIAMQFDYMGSDLRVSYFIGGSYCQSVTYAGAADLIGNWLVLQTTDGKTLTYQSVGSRSVKEQGAVSYNLADGAYLVTGTAVSVNGKAAAAGDVLEQPGGYVIERLEGGIVYKQTVSLYRVGDVNLDGTAATAEDLASLEALLGSGEDTTVVDTAAEYGADLNNDDKVTVKDLALMRSICEGKKTFAEVVKTYYPASLSFDYLGGNGVMPIAGYYGPYRRGSVYDYLSDSVFSLVKESGVNLINYAWNAFGESNDELTTLQLAEKYGLGYFAGDWVLNAELDEATGDRYEGTVLTQKEVAEQLSKYSFYESYLGMHVADEPYPNARWAQLSGNTNRQLKYYDGIATTMNTYANTVGFINAMPEDASAIRLSGMNYSQYLDAILETNQKVLSFDDYPFNDSETEGVTNAGGYFTSLWQVRSKALQNNIPFWGYVQAGGHFTESKTSTNAKLQPTEAETYWNVNTMLAFGAKGIEWFTLIQPDAFSYTADGRDYDRNGLIGADKTTTPFYAYAQKMNTHIAGVDEVLMKAESNGLMATTGHASTEVREGGATLMSSTENMLADTNPIVTSNTEYGALVGCFNYQDTEAFYVVNYDVTKEQEITLNFDVKRMYRLLRDGAESDGSGKSVTLTIPAGEAVLVVLGVVKGDANGDGIHNSGDLVRHKRIAANVVGIDFTKGYDADLNEDSYIDEKDAAKMRQILVAGTAQ